jgi:hypothetical protein
MNSKGWITNHERKQTYYANIAFCKLEFIKSRCAISMGQLGSLNGLICFLWWVSKSAKPGRAAVRIVVLLHQYSGPVWYSFMSSFTSSFTTSIAKHPTLCPTLWSASLKTHSHRVKQMVKLQKHGSLPRSWSCSWSCFLKSSSTGEAELCQTGPQSALRRSPHAPIPKSSPMMISVRSHWPRTPRCPSTIGARRSTMPCAAQTEPNPPPNHFGTGRVLGAWRWRAS